MNQQIKSTCCYCGVGCGLLIETEDGQIVGVRGDPDHPANLGRLCSKGAALHLTAKPDYRLLHPNCAWTAVSRVSASAGTRRSIMRPIVLPRSSARMDRTASPSTSQGSC
jgi:hypothetical protein